MSLIVMTTYFCDNCGNSFLFAGTTTTCQWEAQNPGAVPMAVGHTVTPTQSAGPVPHPAPALLT